MDDYVHRVILRGQIPGWRADPWTLYDFTRPPPEFRYAIEHGMFPWWTADDFKIRFFRPLSSLLVAFDHSFDQRAPLVGHTQSLLWFALLLWLAAAILRAILPEKTAITATWCYALAAHHASGVQWIAARNSLLAGVFGLATVALYVRSLGANSDDRARGVRTGTLSAIALFVGLFAGETVLGAIVVLAALDVLLVPTSALAQRATRLSAPVLVGVAYLAVYARAGFGVRSSGIYHDPLREFSAYRAHFYERWVSLLADGVSEVPADFLMFGGSVARTTATVATVTLTLLCALLWSIRRSLDHSHRRALAALAAASAVALLPSVAGAPGSRMLPIVGLCIAGVMGTTIRQSSVFLQSKPPWSGRIIAAPLLYLFVFCQFVLGPLLRVAQPLNMAKMGSEQAKIAREIEWQCNSHSVLLMLNSSDPSVAMYALPLLLDAGHVAGVGQLLSMAPTEHVLTRVDERSFLLRTADRRSLLASTLGGLYRAPTLAMPVGFVRRYQGLSITVSAINDSGPTEILVQTHASMRSPDVCIYEWKSGRLRPFALPASGQSVVVAHEVGPMGL